jgi:3,4-dihydroxy-2-butanone 4-phosphate synthase
MSVTTPAHFEQVERTLTAFAQGGFVIVVDDESRENEGDLMIAAEFMTTEAMRFMLDHTSGVVAVPMPDRRLRELDLPQMVEDNTGLHQTAFTISVDLKEGGTTGISAQERASTVRALADPHTRPDGLARPGHIFPLRAVPGGVLSRDGHTEAGTDLSLLCGLSGVTALCEIVRSDWSMARRDDLLILAEKEDLPTVSVRALQEYRRRPGAPELAY